MSQPAEKSRFGSRSPRPPHPILTFSPQRNFQVCDIAQIIPVPNRGQFSHSGIGTTEAILTASAEKGRKVLERATERYLDLIRDLEAHYTAAEVPGVDVRTRPEAKRFSVRY